MHWLLVLELGSFVVEKPFGVDQSSAADLNTIIGRLVPEDQIHRVDHFLGKSTVLNLLGWPRDKLPTELAAEVLRGGLEVGRAAHCHVAGGHSIDDPEPKYGMAVTGAADPDALLSVGLVVPGVLPRVTEMVGLVARSE